MILLSPYMTHRHPAFSSVILFSLRSAAQVLRNVRADNAWPGKQRCFQAKRRLVMQGIFPPVGHHKFRQNHCQSLLKNPNRANPVKTRKNQPAMNWCAPVKRKIPAASDATNMKSWVKLPTHQTIRHCLSRSCVCVSGSFHSARCW